MGGQMFWGASKAAPAVAPAAPAAAAPNAPGGSSWSLIPPEAYGVMEYRAYRGGNGLNDNKPVGAVPANQQCYVDSEPVREGCYWFVLAASVAIEGPNADYPYLFLVPERDRGIVLLNRPTGGNGFPPWPEWVNLVPFPAITPPTCQMVPAQGMFVVPPGFFLRASSVSVSGQLGAWMRMGLVMAQLPLPCVCE